MGLLKRLPSLSFKGLYKSSEQPPSSTKAKPDDYALSSQVNSWTDPSAGTSFFDDIFMELGQSLPTQSLPTIQDTDTNMTPTQLDSPSISPNSHNTVLSTPTNEPFLPSIPTNLDSDVSEDEDEDNGNDDDDNDLITTNKELYPIMERHHRPNSNRKKLDRSMACQQNNILDRMKDRHRQQVKFQTMRHTNNMYPRLMSPHTLTKPKHLNQPIDSCPSSSSSSSTTNDGSISSREDDDIIGVTFKHKKKQQQHHHQHFTHGLKSMTSEPDLKRLNPPSHHHHSHHHHHHQYYQHQQQLLYIQQQQLRLEWERIRLYQLQQDYLLQMRQPQGVQRSTTLPSLCQQTLTPGYPTLF